MRTSKPQWVDHEVNLLEYEQAAIDVYSCPDRLVPLNQAPIPSLEPWTKTDEYAGTRQSGQPRASGR